MVSTEAAFIAYRNALLAYRAAETVAEQAFVNVTSANKCRDECRLQLTEAEYELQHALLTEHALMSGAVGD